MSELKITIESSSGWDIDYLRSIFDGCESLKIGKPFVKTGLTPFFMNHKIEITFEKISKA